MPSRQLNVSNAQKRIWMKWKNYDSSIVRWHLNWGNERDYTAEERRGLSHSLQGRSGNKPSGFTAAPHLTSHYILARFTIHRKNEAHLKKQENQERWWNIWPLRKYWFRTESARIIIWWEKFIRIQSFFHYTMISEKSYSRDHKNVMCRKVWTELNTFLYEQIHSREIPYKCVLCGRVLEKDRLSKDISDLTQEKNPTNA